MVELSKQDSSQLCQKKKSEIKTVRPSDYVNPDIPDRRWRVYYGYRQEFFLTDKERAFFLGAVKGGSTLVQVGDLTLTGKFLFMCPIKGKAKKEDSPANLLPKMSPEEKAKSREALDKMRKNFVNILNKKNE